MFAFRRVVPVAAMLAPLWLMGVAPAGAGPSLTIYSHDLALVRERCPIEVRGARDTVRIADLAQGLDFTSLRFIPASGRVTRLAWRPAQSGGDELLGSSIGRRVRVTTHADRTLEGVLLSADGSWLVIRGDDASLTTIARPNAEEVRLADAPASLIARPTLEAVIEGSTQAKQSAEVSYLTSGLSWSCEHVLVRKSEGAGTWSAGVTVANNTGRDFVDTDLELVAGDPHRESESPRPMLMGAMAKSSMVAAEAAPDLSEQAFSEYHLYTLDRPATLRDREAQSLSMIAPRDVKLTPRYLYRGGDARGVMSQIEIVNDKASGPGVPLPGGRVRLYEATASGALRLIGESRIGHTAVGEKFTLDVGTAFDLVAEKRQTADRRIADREREISVEIVLRNRKDTAVTIVVEEGVQGDFEITAKSHDFVLKDAHTLVFTIPVAAGKEEKLAYTAHLRY
jgi:hypothetical protein